MSRRAAAVLALLLVLLSFPPAPLAAELEDLLFDLQIIPLLGQDPPAFTLEDLEGKKVSLAAYRGKPVLLYFWASW